MHAANTKFGRCCAGLGMLSDRRRRNKGGRFQKRTYWTARWLIARQPCRSPSPAFLCFPSGIADCRMWGKERRNGKAITFSKTRLPQPALEVVKEAESSTFSPAFTVSATSDQKTFIRKGLRDRANHSKGRFVNSLYIVLPVCYEGFEYSTPRSPRDSLPSSDSIGPTIRPSRHLQSKNKGRGLELRLCGLIV